ncbi:MAG TPA: S8 family serine peptidase, partial [Verrucomicrobiae bacterium]|nr:S8 family serine peptidase [Verrucomicrobiae bacterium]
MISVRSLFSAWAFAVGFALQALAASEIRIVDGGQPRQFEIETGVVASSDSTNAPDIFLFEANKARTAFNRRRMTSDILVELNAGADPKKVGETVSVESLRLINAERRWYIFQVKEPALVLSVVEKLRAHADIASAEPILAKRKVRKFVPSDPLLPTEWHLNNTGANGALAGVDLHVTNTWAQYRGKGVVIAIIDDGLDTSHPDLAPHIDPALGYDWNDGDTDPTAHPAKGDFHGTECAGAAAAVGDNSAGVAGVAFEATIAGLRLISGDTTDETEAAAMLFKNQQIDIKNNSWGPDDDGMTLEAPGPLTLAALEESVRTGRGGKGTIFVFPGGNGLDTGDNANYDGYANSIYTIAVGAVSDQGFQTDYSEPGACLVVTVPGGSFGRPSIVTTDLQGPEGVNRIGEPDDLADLDYTSGFTGTSASVALTSGAIALMLNANPNLGWRDVQEILLRSATKVDPHDPDWDMNSAGLSFNHKFGAGLLNVDNAVALALIWSNLPPQTNLSSIQNNLNVAIPDNDPSGVTREFDFRSSSIRLEQVTLTANI